MNAAETILHSQHTSSHWLHLHLLITGCVSLMIFEKFLAASLLSSAHIALSENLSFSLSLLHRHHPDRASCMLMADHRSHSHRITSRMPAVWLLLLFWFGLPSFLFFYLEFPSSPPTLLLFTLLFSSLRSLLPVP